MTWTRIRVRNNGAQESKAPTRTYGLDGKLYPRISISLFMGTLSTPNGLRIECSMKPGRDRWWQPHDIPPSLVPELIQMLQELPCAPSSLPSSSS